MSRQVTPTLQADTNAEGRIHWTAKTRALIEPHQRSVLSSPQQPDLEHAVARIQKALDFRAKEIELGLPSADQHCRELMTAVLQSLQRPADAWLSDAVEVDAARAVLTGVERNGARSSGGGTTYWLDADSEIDDAFLDLWSLRGGLHYAIEMLVRCHAYDVVLVNNSFCLDPSEKWEPRWCPHDGIWLKLRLRLTSCPDAEYDTSRQAAARLRESSNLALRCCLDYAFPEEAGWAATDAARAVAREAAGSREGRLLACLRDPALAEGVARNSDYGASVHVHTMLDLLGVAGAPVLEAMIAGSWGWAMSARRKLAGQLAIIESPRVASFFASHLTDPGVAKAATAYFEKWPDLARVALRDAVSADKPGARELLGLFEQRSATARAGRARASERASATEHAGTLDSPSNVVQSALPAVLATPLWRTRAKPARTTAVVRGLIPVALPESLEWKPGEREFHRSGRGCRFSLVYPEHWRPRSPEEDEAEYLAYFQRDREAAAPEAHMGGLFRLSEETALATWNSFPPRKYRFFDVADLHRILARHELAALPGFFAFAGIRLSLVVEVLARVRSPRIAPVMAEAFTRLVGARRVASGWLLAFPKEAAVGLVPQAVGEPGPSRREAEAALRWLAAQGQGAAVREAAEMYGPEAHAAVEAALAFDPYSDFPRRMPELSVLYWTPSLWPRPRLRDSDQTLSDDAIDALGTMLAFSAPDDPYVGIDDVKRACDPESLAAFVWALFEAWQNAGAPAKGDWAFRALIFLGDDDTARRLAARLEPWSKEGRYGRAVTGLRVLAAMNSDTALACVRGIAEKAKSRPLRAEGRQRLEELAERRGLTADQLADLLVPDLGFDESGTRTLEFGPRWFAVGLDPHLKPQIRDQAGKVLRDLPEPGTKDDPDRAQAAVTEWKALKRQLAAVRKSETARLELAMCSRRRWAAREFSDVIVLHPILGWLARRLVWGAYDGAERLIGTFRVAEDRTLADDADNAWSIADGLTVGLVHVVELEDAFRRRWAALLADYELEQPFAQLGREVFRAGTEDLPKRAIGLLAGHQVSARKLLSLESRGWDRVGGKDIGALVKRLHSLECEAELPLTPGLFAGDLPGSPEQTLGPVVLHRLGTWGEEDCLSIEEMGPVLYSEIVRDLMSLRV